MLCCCCRRSIDRYPNPCPQAPAMPAIRTETTTGKVDFEVVRYLEDSIPFPERSLSLVSEALNPESRPVAEQETDILLKDWAKKYPTYSSCAPLPQCHHDYDYIYGSSKRPSGEYLVDRSADIPASHQLSVHVSVDDIAIYGWQILKAMIFLYKQGFPVLGQVHSGNIFVQDGVCRLGGYENTLLGYRSRYYRMCQNHLELMDVIMFGHVVFEMCCGYELTTVFPTAQDYQAVKRVEGGERVEEVLRYMFYLVTSRAYGSMEMVKMIKDHDFFRGGKENVQLKDKSENIFQRLVLWTVGGEKVLLARVRQGVDSKAERSISSRGTL